MTTNADLIAQWRNAHPAERLSVPVLLGILGLTTLAGADLRGAYLRGADLRGADLAGADLRGADLAWADLAWADLRGACLRGADLAWADLARADLAGACLAGANLRGAVHEHIMPINAGASGMGALYPQSDGWRVSIGCWRHHALDELGDLLGDRIAWPEAVGEERERRRPLLAAIRTTCLAFIDQMPADLIEQHAAARAEVTS